MELTEGQWSHQVKDLAQYRGWWGYHPYDSRKSEPGWPDWVFIKRERMIVAELKTNKGRLSPDQKKVLGLLDAVPGVEVYVWRPRDLEEVQDVLLKGINHETRRTNR